MIEYERSPSPAGPTGSSWRGDVNSTLACALVAPSCAFRSCIWRRVCGAATEHAEEINRLPPMRSPTSWTPSADADANLLRENVPAGKIDRVGNFMIDSYEMLRFHRLRRDGGAAGAFAARLCRNHPARPSNVDSADSLSALIGQLARASDSLPLVFAVHPRTRKRLIEFGSCGTGDCANIRLTEPLDTSNS